MQRALAELLPREVKDPRVGSVTITAVTLARGHERGAGLLPAVRQAQAQRRRSCCAGLQQRGRVPARRGRRAQLGLRHAPRLEFVLDAQLERAQS